MVENFGKSVRAEISHKAILTSQFVRTRIGPQFRYAWVLLQLFPVHAEIHASQPDIHSVPTTELDVSRIKTICRPIPEET